MPVPPKTIAYSTRLATGPIPSKRHFTTETESRIRAILEQLSSEVSFDLQVVDFSTKKFEEQVGAPFERMNSRVLVV